MHRSTEWARGAATAKVPRPCSSTDRPGAVGATGGVARSKRSASTRALSHHAGDRRSHRTRSAWLRDRKSTRLNSSHVASSYAVFCLKQKTKRFINDAANSADRSDTWNSYGPDSVQVSREFERNRRRRELLSIV